MKNSIHAQIYFILQKQPWQLCKQRFYNANGRPNLSVYVLVVVNIEAWYYNFSVIFIYLLVDKIVKKAVKGRVLHYITKIKIFNTITGITTRKSGKTNSVTL